MYLRRKPRPSCYLPVPEWTVQATNQLPKYARVSGLAGRGMSSPQTPSNPQSFLLRGIESRQSLFLRVPNTAARYNLDACKQLVNRFYNIWPAVLIIVPAEHTPMFQQGLPR